MSVRVRTEVIRVSVRVRAEVIRVSVGVRAEVVRVSVRVRAEGECEVESSVRVKNQGRA